MLNKPARPSVSAHIANAFSDFRSDERGSLSIFVLFAFVFMLLIGGIAIDYMRFEVRRVAMQQTMDRASLAAASLTNDASPQEVAEDYFAKARLGYGVKSVAYSDPVVTVVSGQNNASRKVRVTASVRSYNYFMGSFFLPVDYLETPAASQAEQGAEQIEVMMVLDVTGSMNDTPAGDTKKKIDGLKDAAISFINLTEEADSLDQVSIGIVPYNTQVNLGRTLREKYTETNIPVVAGVGGVGVPNVNCLQPGTTVADFNTTGISLTTPMPMSVHADLESGASATTSYVAWSATNASSGGTLLNWNNPVNGGSNYMCPPYAYSEVQLPTKEPGPLIAKIESLQPNGRTSIMMGMRWGVALLDESAQPIYEDLVWGSESAMSGRPAANTDPKTRKIIILMTDGNHVATKEVKGAYRTGQSPIFRSAVDNNFSIMLKPAADPKPYWVPHLCTGATTALRDGCSVGWRAAPWSNAANTGTSRQLDWSEVWQEVRITWVARQLYGRSLYQAGKTANTIYNEQIALFRSDTYLSKATMDARLQTSCSAAKASGMEVFGIAFGAGSDGETQIRGCASSESASDPTDKTGYYFKPQTAAELDDAFKDIFDKISPLRLTE